MCDVGGLDRRARVGGKIRHERDELGRAVLRDMGGDG